MGKKSKSKASREVNDDAVVVEEEKLPSSVKKPISEVDKTSSAKKRKKTETEKAENPLSSAKKPASEIDEIFAAKKKKTETGKAKKRKENAIEKPDKPKTKKKDKGIRDGGFGDMSSQPKKRRQDGLTVYTEEELGINKADAGNTPLCPFDCSCCF